MKISLIIATYNQEWLLDLILTALKAQELCHNCSVDDIEIIIADDGSTQATQGVIAKHLTNQLPFALQHVYHEDVGFRKSMILNKAVAKAHGDYLVFLDGDCVPPVDYLKQHYLLREAGYFVAGNRILLSKKYTALLKKIPLKQAVRLSNSNFIRHVINYLRGYSNKLLVNLRLSPNAKWRYFRQANWQYPKGCNFAMWRSDYLKINGYDEAFSGWGHEDADLFIRLLHCGIKIKDGRFASSIFHLWHTNASRQNEAQNYQRLRQRLSDVQMTQALVGVDQYLD